MMDDREIESLPPFLPLPRRAPSRDRVQAHMQELDPSLDPASSRFRAATLLLAAAQLGQNVDRLARWAGYDRNFVARCARRLIDNGVWRDGRTVGEWVQAGGAHRTFWNDVAVAEGKCCRRLGADGEPEWAAAGEWNKSYEYVEAQPRSGLSVLYHTAPEPLSDTLPSPDPEDADATADAAAQDGQDMIVARSVSPASHATNNPAPTRATVRSRRASPFRPSRRRKRLRAARTTPAASDATRAGDPFAELFPGAAWLG